MFVLDGSRMNLGSMDRCKRQSSVLRCTSDILEKFSCFFFFKSGRHVFLLPSSFPFLLPQFYLFEVCVVVFDPSGNHTVQNVAAAIIRTVVVDIIIKHQNCNFTPQQRETNEIVLYFLYFILTLTHGSSTQNILF